MKYRNYTILPHGDNYIVKEFFEHDSSLVEVSIKEAKRGIDQRICEKQYEKSMKIRLQGK